MPIIRNPFSRKTASGDVPVVEQRPEVDYFTKKEPPSSIDIKPSPEFKLSEISGDGVYLPPSPTEDSRSFWHSRSNTSRSTNSSNYRTMLSETNDQFNISRESFDSYRRSFDISARSPVTKPDHAYPPRQSLDSRRARLAVSRNNSVGTPPLPRPATPLEDEAFEDVGLNDEPAKPHSNTKKRGIFSRFGGEGDHAQTQNDRPSSSGHLGFHFSGGRRRGQSGQGSELGSMKRDGQGPESRIDP
ncbi:MAG: hypothetical protein M1821_003537 [Bathelium mastoideum]|nr:MAG: hypothetical protein M1821_003537 [Bathelium mastoideum]KAI9682624.1 MAG: hypothetical protein M1822_006922 [Bathelium mastoideum]